jgi:hypothetical protein
MPETLTPNQRADRNKQILRRRPRPDHKIMSLAYMVENLAQLIPEAREVLRWRLAQADGQAGSSGPSVSGGATSNPTLSAVEACTTTQAELEQLDDDIATIVVMISDMTNMARRIVGQAIQPEAERCDSRGRDGALLTWTPGQPLDDGNGWSDPTCENIASRGPLCDTCSRREQRWRAHRGLTARDDGAFSQPATQDVA